MGLLKAVWGWLTWRDRKSLKKGHPDLNPYDVARLVDELNLVPEARRLGKAGVPAPDATRPGGAEAEAIQRVDKVRQDYVDWAMTRLSVINEALTKSDITHAVNRARQADKEFERKASSLMTEREAVLRATGDRARQLDGELKGFRSQHHLTRQPAYPTVAGKFLSYAILAVLVVVEGVVNAKFFAEGVDSGLFGGAGYAMALAFLNVSAAFAFGKWPSRYVRHHQISLKIVGWLFTAGALIVVVAVGLGIAHFRDALTAGGADAPAEALRALVESPWHLKDLMSWGLFGISVLFGLIAYFDGVLSDDPYPGYGNVARRADEAAKDYEDELQSLRSELDAVRTEELKLLDEAAREAQGGVARYANLIGEKRAASSRLEKALGGAAYTLDAVLLKFRQENEVARQGLARPAYFDRPTELSSLTLPDFGTEADEVCLAEQKELAATFVAELQETRSRIQAALNQKFDLLQPLQQQFGAPLVTA